MKKTVIVLMLTLAAMFSMGLSVSANNSNGAAPCYLYTYTAKSTLTASGTTATCESLLNGASSVTKISAVQYLEKKNGSEWETVSGGTWSDSVKGNSLTLSNSKSDLSGGTYRLRTVFTVYSGAKYETVEKTSPEETI